MEPATKSATDEVADFCKNVLALDSSEEVRKQLESVKVVLGPRFEQVAQDEKEATRMLGDCDALLKRLGCLGFKAQTACMYLGATLGLDSEAQLKMPSGRIVITSINSSKPDYEFPVKASQEWELDFSANNDNVAFYTLKVSSGRKGKSETITVEEPALLVICDAGLYKNDSAVPPNAIGQKFPPPANPKDPVDETDPSRALPDDTPGAKWTTYHKVRNFASILENYSGDGEKYGIIIPCDPTIDITIKRDKDGNVFNIELVIEDDAAGEGEDEEFGDYSGDDSNASD